MNELFTTVFDMTKVKVEGDVEFLKRLGQEDIFSRKTIHLLVTEKDLPLFLTISLLTKLKIPSEMEVAPRYNC